MQKAIKKAIEGEYEIQNLIFNGKIVYENPLKSEGNKTWGYVLLDPLFWQALGKAEGWGYIGEQNGITVRVRTAVNHITGEEWLHYWHSFIDHLASGGSADEFFNNLLK